VVAISGLVVGLAMTRTLAVPLPSLLGGTQAPVPIAVIAPVGVAIVLAYALASGNPDLERVASRPLPWFDAAYVLAAASATLAACVLGDVLAGEQRGAQAGRNALGYIGLMMLARGVVGATSAAIVPATFVILATLFRGATARWATWWTWPLASPADVASWAVVLTLLLVGVAVSARRQTDALGSQ
jgi:hypothetical protein